MRKETSHSRRTEENQSILRPRVRGERGRNVADGMFCRTASCKGVIGGSVATSPHRTSVCPAALWHIYEQQRTVNTSNLTPLLPLCISGADGSKLERRLYRASRTTFRVGIYVTLDLLFNPFCGRHAGLQMTQKRRRSQQKCLQDMQNLQQVLQNAPPLVTETLVQHADVLNFSNLRSRSLLLF